MKCNTIEHQQSIQKRMENACISRTVVTKSKINVLGATACMVIGERAKGSGNFATAVYYENSNPTGYTITMCVQCMEKIETRTTEWIG